MSNHFEVEPSILTKQSSPTNEFGNYVTEGPVWEETVGQFEQVVDEAHKRVSEIFGDLPAELGTRVARIDEIIDQMWGEGWSPIDGDLDLFVRDFGSLVAVSLRDQLNGRPVIRSKQDLTHFSLHWTEPKLEAFPFHKVHERLVDEHASSLAEFYESVGDAVAGFE